MCLSIYLVHVLYLKATTVVHDPILNLSFSWMFLVYALDVVISVLLSGIVYLMVEAPGTQLVEILSRILSIRKADRL
jgi:peptidoglycan/LPS O-acetylase OafA/YrhL